MYTYTRSLDKEISQKINRNIFIVVLQYIFTGVLLRIFTEVLLFMRIMGFLKISQKNRRSPFVAEINGTRGFTH